MSDALREVPELTLSARRVTMLVFVLAFLIMSTTGVAQSYDRVQGADVSYSWDYNHSINVCDREADGNGVFSYYDTYRSAGSGPLIKWDSNGSQTYCGYVYYDYTQIYRHQTCEDVPGWPNACTDFSYNGH